MTIDCVSAAKVSPPSVRLNSSKQGLVVQVKASRVLMRKVHNGVDNNIYVVHPGGKEAREPTQIITHNLCSSVLPQICQIVIKTFFVH